MKAVDYPHHMCRDPAIMKVTTLDHVKASSDIHHMYEEAYTMSAVIRQHVPSLQECRHVLVNEHHLTQQ